MLAECLLKIKKDYKDFRKACFQYDMAYGNFKDLPRRAASVKVLHDKVFNIAKNPKYDRCKCGLVSLFYKFFYKKPSAGAIKKKIVPNQQPAEELHKPIIRKIK